MNKIYKILMLGLILSVMIQTASALKEGQDYTCIYKVAAKTPLPTTSVNIDKSIDKTPLCSEGKVPKAITSDIDQNVNDVLQDINISAPSTAICVSGICRDIAYSYQNVGNLGVRAYLTQHNPVIDSIKGIHSKASIETGDFSGNGIQTGWKKTKGGVTRLFVAWWRNNIFQCYNGCGWIQESNHYYPGMPIDLNNNGVGYIIQNIFWCTDPPNCEDYEVGWVVSYNDEMLGYYPHGLWNQQFQSGNYVKYQGEVVSYAPVTTTDMGNGLWASNSYAAKIFSQQYAADCLDNTGPAIGWLLCWHNVNTIKSTTSPNLYSVLATSSNSMRYGGPGSTAGITVISPNGGESWRRGTTHTISWSKDGNVGTYVKIQLYKAGILKSTINSYTSNDGSYSWNIPWSLLSGTDYKIKITSTSNSIYNDWSNSYFRIY